MPKKQSRRGEPTPPITQERVAQLFDVMNNEDAPVSERFRARDELMTLYVQAGAAPAGSPLKSIKAQMTESGLVELEYVP
jgi:hypothetical protein